MTQAWVPPMWQIDLLQSDTEQLDALRTALETSKPDLVLQCARRHTLGRIYNIGRTGPVLIFTTSEPFGIANRDPAQPDRRPKGFREHRWHYQAAPLDPTRDERITQTRDEVELAAAEQEWVDLQCRCRHGRLTRADLRRLLADGPQRTVVHLR